MRRVFSHAFGPLLLGAMGVGLWQREAIELELARVHVPLDGATVLSMGLLLLLFLAEQLVPARPEWNKGFFVRGPGLGRDLLYLVLIAQFSSAFIALSKLWVTHEVEGTGVGFDSGLAWPAEWPFAAKVALAFFVAEFFSYWWHRFAHRVPLLWQFHSTHHVITEVTALKALRTHPLENLCFWFARHALLFVLGAGSGEVVAAATLGGMLGLLSHANLDLAPGPLGWVVNFPRYHVVHHSHLRAESDSNFGCHTVLFDRLFGTFRDQAGEPLIAGVDPVRPRTLFEELVAPFFRDVTQLDP